MRKVLLDNSVVEISTLSQVWSETALTPVRVTAEETATTGYLMAHAILNDMPMERSRKGYINSSAHIIERRTTA